MTARLGGAAATRRVDWRRLTSPPRGACRGGGCRYKLVTSNASLREIKLLRELTHPNIVTLRDQFVNLNDMSLALVYDYGAASLVCGAARAAGIAYVATARGDMGVPHWSWCVVEQPRRTCA